MMPFLSLRMFSAKSLAQEEVAEKLYGLLNSWDFPPEKFSKYEPIRTNWTAEEQFLSIWMEEGQTHFGQVLMRRRKKPSYYADVTFHFGPDRLIDKKPPYHSVSVYKIKMPQITKDFLEKLIAFGDQVFSELKIDYGFICYDDEYTQKNIIKNYRCPDGSLEPTKVVGMRWPYCIPGLYWTNYYGQIYLDHGFASDFLEKHPENVTTIQGGIRIQTSNDPGFFRSAEAPSVENEMRDLLGQDWFYGPKNNKECKIFDSYLEQIRHRFTAPKIHPKFE